MPVFTFVKSGSHKMSTRSLGHGSPSCSSKQMTAAVLPDSCHTHTELGACTRQSSGWFARVYLNGCVRCKVAVIRRDILVKNSVNKITWVPCWGGLLAGSSSGGAPDQATASPKPRHPAHPPLGTTSQKWRVKLLRAEIVDDVFAGALDYIPLQQNSNCLVQYPLEGSGPHVAHVVII